jgi:cation transport regulator
MAKQLDEFPSDIKESLLDGSQQVFMAAYTSAADNGMSEEAATKVAWTTIEHAFAKGEDGKWHRRADEPGIHNKSITTGGN